MDRKLQVFISSTYTDLKDERQAAVEAILRAGHIPAGMELFAAGDQSQMEVIRNWIDDSDVFLLILGGRYGSIEPESGKSYVQIEYEYALAKRKPWFACVIYNDELKRRGNQDYEIFRETKNVDKLENFRSTLTSKTLVQFWSDPRDIKLAIFQSLSDFSQRKNIQGWVKDSIDFQSIMLQFTQLSTEHSKIKSEKNNYRSLGLSNIYRDFSREQFREKLEKEDVSNGIDILQTFAPNLDYFKEALIKCLNKGANIRLLLSWPKSPAAKLREDALSRYNKNSILSVTRSNVEQEVTKNLETLEEIFRRINNLEAKCAGSLQVRLYNSIPSISMYRINDYFLIGVFLHGRLAVSSFQLELTGMDTTLVYVCSSEFNQIWEMAREIMPHSLDAWRLNIEGLF
jgi:Domain of unknown function (DUF4062)